MGLYGRRQRICMWHCWGYKYLSLWKEAENISPVVRGGREAVYCTAYCTSVYVTKVGGRKADAANLHVTWQLVLEHTVCQLLGESL